MAVAMLVAVLVAVLDAGIRRAAGLGAAVRLEAARRLDGTGRRLERRAARLDGRTTRLRMVAMAMTETGLGDGAEREEQRGREAAE
jgi:hypothetical protein